MEKTFVMVKPDGFQKGLVGEVIKRLENEDLNIIDIKKSVLSEEKVCSLYKDSMERFPQIREPMVKYMTEGPSILLLVEGKDAIKTARNVRGLSDPSISSAGTVRKDFAGDQIMTELTKKGEVTKNIMHASGNKEEVKFEVDLFFGDEDG